jgi:hypothetical protein
VGLSVEDVALQGYGVVRALQHVQVLECLCQEEAAGGAHEEGGGIERGEERRGGATGTQFTRAKAKAKAKAKATDTATPKAGAVKTTDRAALDATLSKALAQARLLGLDSFAAEILDMCIESLDGFTEVVAK